MRAGMRREMPRNSSVNSVRLLDVDDVHFQGGLILLNRYRALEQSGMSAADAIRNGSVERLIPIIMTSLTTILGLLPLVWARNQPGGELLAPLAIVQFGGLLSATILNLLLIPSTSSLFAKFLAPRSR